MDTQPEDGMPTTAGSFALVDTKTPGDAPAVARLKEAGAIIVSPSCNALGISHSERNVGTAGQRQFNRMVLLPRRPSEWLEPVSDCHMLPLRFEVLFLMPSLPISALVVKACKLSSAVRNPQPQLTVGPHAGIRLQQRAKAILVVALPDVQQLQRETEGQTHNH